MSKVLCVVTSHGVKGSTGEQTGFWLSELTHPLEKMHNAGIETELASIKGGTPPIDKNSMDLSDEVNAKYWNDEKFQEQYKNTIKLSDVNYKDYDGIFFAGGHGAMWDFPDSEDVNKISSAIYENGGFVAAVCHGPAALVNIKLSDGSYLVSGKKVTGFTDDEEREIKFEEYVPFLLETELRKRGGIFQAKANWTTNVVSDKRLITGQNPGSAAEVGEAIVKLINECV